MPNIEFGKTSYKFFGRNYSLLTTFMRLAINLEYFCNLRTFTILNMIN